MAGAIPFSCSKPQVLRFVSEGASEVQVAPLLAPVGLTPAAPAVTNHCLRASIAHLNDDARGEAVA
jgi:hypothetical protein